MVILPSRRIGRVFRQNRPSAALDMGKRSQLTRMDEPDDDVSWREWFQRFGPRLLLCARQWVGRQADAEDIVQDAFVRYWRRQRTMAADALPLVLISVRRAAYDLARKAGRRAGARSKPPAKVKGSTPGSNPPPIPTTAAKRSRPPSANFRSSRGKSSPCAFGVNSLSNRLPISLRFRRTRPHPAIATACSPCGKHCAHPWR